jgi:hypothetical protein
VRAALVALALAACTRSEPAADRAPAPPDATAIAPPDAAAARTDCADQERSLLGAVNRAERAMDARDRQGGVAAWRDFPAACRGAAWFHAAAILLRGGARGLDGVASVRDAIDRGLAADPADARLLGYAAYLHALDAALAPAPAIDTCGRDGVDAAYVCAHRALAAGANEDAAARFAAIADPPFPDVGVRRVQALAGAGHAKAARAAAADARALIDRHDRRPGVIDPDVAALTAQLDAALR